MPEAKRGKTPVARSPRENDTVHLHPKNERLRNGSNRSVERWESEGGSLRHSPRRLPKDSAPLAHAPVHFRFSE